MQPGALDASHRDEGASLLSERMKSIATLTNGSPSSIGNLRYKRAQIKIKMRGFEREFERQHGWRPGPADKREDSDYAKLKRELKRVEAALRIVRGVHDDGAGKRAALRDIAMQSKRAEIAGQDRSGTLTWRNASSPDVRAHHGAPYRTRGPHVPRPLSDFVADSSSAATTAANPLPSEGGGEETRVDASPPAIEAAGAAVRPNTTLARDRSQPSVSNAPPLRTLLPQGTREGASAGILRGSAHRFYSVMARLLTFSHSPLAAPRRPQARAPAG